MMNKKIAVIGRGVCGLSSAIQLADKGYSVDIFSKDEPSKTTSMSAGAYWWQHKAYPKERVLKWSKVSYEEFKILAKTPESGISMQEHYRYCVVPDDSAYSVKVLDELCP